MVPQIIIPGGVSNVTIDGVVGGGWEYRDIKFTGGQPNYDVTIGGGSNGPGYNIFILTCRAVVGAYGGKPPLRKRE